MWIARKSEGLVRRLAAQFPVVLVTGPRQAGKTALLRKAFPGASYISLDLPATAAAARGNPESFLGSLAEPAIIDEVQYAPELFRGLKAFVDRRRTPGRFLLTGSQHLPLMQGVSESLAGRCGVMSLATLSWAEARTAGRAKTVEQFLFRGGYPELHATEADPELWYSSYLATYLERDARNILNVSDLGDLDRFLRASALRTAQVLSYADLARDVGVAPATAKAWMNVLVATGLVTLLEPYHSNRGKRLTKSPKLHFSDAGLACRLMGFRTAADALGSALSGALWESFVIGQYARRFAGAGTRPPLYYWRTPGGHEVDLVIEEGGGRMSAVECKLSENPTTKDCSGIAALRSFYGAQSVPKAFIACRTGVGHPVGPGVTAIGPSEF